MATPQGGILPEPGSHALFLVLKVRSPRHARAVAKIAARVPALAAQVARLDKRSRLVANVAFGTRLWSRISRTSKPRGFRPFKKTGKRTLVAPSTGGDILLHAISNRQDLNFEIAQRLRSELGDRVRVLEEVHGFRYLDARDLTGFIDGTENPKGKRERANVALIGDEDRAFAGGSFVFTQRYVHDLSKWSRLSDAAQEKQIGRRKKNSVELRGKAKPPTAHISRVVIEEKGEELEIVRHSFPYGDSSEAGLFFIAYTNDLAIPFKMLDRMLGASGDGKHDHLMDYTKAVSGATFFAPSLSVLRSIAR
ncbi:MAG: Dyp-type peroxidase [Candidatus Binatia bacterium]|nr:Dyp-type peroxidase [Candidatus Binatia bacterium]